MRTLALVGATLSLVSLLVSPGFAQQVSSLTAAERAGIALARLGARQRVRIRVEGERLIEGSVELASPSLVVLRVDGSPERIPATAVDSLWVHATHWRRGALIGGAIGGIGLGAIAAALVHATCESASGCNDVGGFFVGFLMGGVAGGVTGGLVGAAFPTWQRRVP
ncbi:MAG: hypothetical protein DMD31_14330 [Gemmatimonadetes bacterium]|nr:MAG: hypothetical protein AUG79_05490 [Gemmatimonadetes bacterium 13_1_20CM_4_69_16]PYO13190.1 MAG: hypothetical protein DMD31_14330 [Gemmatimonadota bacterium]